MSALDQLDSLLANPAPAARAGNGANYFEDALRDEAANGPFADFTRSLHHQESSSGSNTKTSNAGAVGGMQIKPTTFAGVADAGWDINDPLQNARGGIRYAKQMWDESGGNPALAAAGYYGGPGGLEKARRGIAVADPRNPNAPNTLQYGQQVAGRMTAPGMSVADQAANDSFADSVLQAGLGVRQTQKDAPAQSAGVVRTVGDMGVKLAQGVVGLGQSVVGLGSLLTGGKAGELMRDVGYDPKATNEFFGTFLSDSQKSSDAKVAAAEGFIDTIIAGIQNPRSIIGGIAESAPGMLGGMGVSAALAGRVAAKAALRTIEGKAAAEAALAAGQTATQAAHAAVATTQGRAAVTAALDAAGGKLMAAGAATEGAQTAGNIADNAQAAGRSYSDYAGPALAAGVGTAVIGYGAGKLLGDAATSIATGSRGAAVKGSLPVRVGKEFVKEGLLEEAPQSAQEQVWTNIAMGEQDIYKGVAEAAGTGLLVGGFQGGAMGAIQNRHKPELQADTGVLSRAANLGQQATADKLNAKAVADALANPLQYENVPINTPQKPGMELVDPTAVTDPNNINFVPSKPTPGGPNAAGIENLQAYGAIGESHSLEDLAPVVARRIAAGMPLTIIPHVNGGYTVAPTGKLTPGVLDAVSHLQPEAAAAPAPRTPEENALVEQALRRTMSAPTGIGQLAQLEQMYADEREQDAQAAAAMERYRTAQEAKEQGFADERAAEAQARRGPATGPTIGTPNEMEVSTLIPLKTSAPAGGRVSDFTKVDEAVAAGYKLRGKMLVSPTGKPFRLNRDELDHYHKGTKAAVLDSAAHAAATSPNNELAEPSQEQKEAGNYKVGHIKLHGLDLSIENPSGSTRRGIGPDGNAWENTMQSHYGYIKGTIGADKDHIDTFVGKNHDSDKVFVVDQVDPATGKFDEHKIMFGENSLEEATASYNANYAEDWTGGRNVTETTVDGLKKWLKDGNTKKPFAKIEKPAKIVLYEGKGGTVLDEQALQRRNLTESGPIGAELIGEEQGGMLAARNLQVAQESFDADGNFIGKFAYRVVPKRAGGSIYSFNDLAEAKQHADTYAQKENVGPTEKRTKVGKGNRGQNIFQNEQGIRSYTESGFKYVEEPGKPRDDNFKSEVELTEVVAAPVVPAGIEKARRIKAEKEAAKLAAVEAAAVAPAKPEPEVKAKSELDLELEDAIAHLGDVLGDVFGAKMNIMGQQHTHSALLPALSKVVELLVRKGIRSFADAVVKASNILRANASIEPYVDQISARQWKAAYNAIAEFHEGTDSEESVLSTDVDALLRADKTSREPQVDADLPGAAEKPAAPQSEAIVAPVKESVQPKTSSAPEHVNNKGKALDVDVKYEPTAKSSTTKDSAPIDETIVPLTMSAADFKEITDEWKELFAAPDKRVVTDQRAKKDGFMSPEAARDIIDGWKAHAAEQGRKHRSENSNKTVLSLFDLSGEWSKPWEEAGYNVIRFDIQSGQDVNDFSVEYFNENYDFSNVYAILAACPCTDFAVSGARHFAEKDADGRTEASKELVFQTMKTIEYFRPAIWTLENPVSRIDSLTGLPPARMSFEPHHFGETYTKKTMLWGKFNAELPLANVDPVEGSKMWSNYGGKSQATKNARSVTPEGFAYAYFMANNYMDMPVEQRLATEYPEASGAVKQAVKAGVTAERIHELMEYTYGNYEHEDARNALVQEVADMVAKGGANVETTALVAPDEPELTTQELNRKTVKDMTDSQLRRALKDLPKREKPIAKEIALRGLDDGNQAEIETETDVDVEVEAVVAAAPDVKPAALDQDAIAKRYAEILAEGRVGVSPVPTKFHFDFAKSVADKDAYALQWIVNGLNDKSKKVFAEFTGTKLPKAQGAAWSALKEWAGVTAEQDSNVVAERAAVRASNAEAIADKDAEDAVANMKFRTSATDDTILSGKDVIDGRIAAGYTVITNVSKTPIPKYVLVNTELNRFFPLTKPERMYAIVALKRLSLNTENSTADVDALMSDDEAASIEAENVRELADAKAKGQKVVSDDEVARLFGKKETKQESLFNDEAPEAAASPELGVVATYVTPGGRIALEITRSVDRDGEERFSYVGAYGAGSGHSAADMAKEVSGSQQRHPGMRLQSGRAIEVKPVDSSLVVNEPPVEHIAAAKRVNEAGIDKGEITEDIVRAKRRLREATAAGNDAKIAETEKEIRQLRQQALAEDASEKPTKSQVDKPIADKDGNTVVGSRADGAMIGQDKNGVRFYVKDGIRISEPVSLRPTRSGMEMERGELKPEFMTVEESGQNDELDTEMRSYEAKGRSDQRKATADTGKSLADINVTTTAWSATGDAAPETKTAEKALTESDSKIKAIENLLNCLLH